LATVFFKSLLTQTGRGTDRRIKQEAAERRRSESDDAFTGCQPQYPDLQGYLNIGFTGVQALLDTIQLNPAHTRHTPAAYPVIEEIVEGFVESF
jgi:hypothetical protein